MQRILSVLLLGLSTSHVLSIDNFRWQSLLDQPVVKEVKSNLRDILKVKADSHQRTMDNFDEGKVEKPAFCHDLDCPDYKVVNKTESYELREYAASHWVSTHLQKYSYDESSGKMFMKLFDYIEGENVNKEKIKMTAPVIVKVVPAPGPACKNDFIMSFFMSPKVKNPPAPTNKDVFFTSLPKQRVFVSSFSGRAHGEDWIKHGDAFAQKLMKDKRKFETDYYYTAGYDSPFRLLFRHNEIWFVAKE